MKQIILKELRLKAFRSFKGLQVIPFLNNGFVHILGQSGVGKSTINLGLAYIFGYCPYPATELQSWLTDEKMQAELDFVVNEDQITLARGENTYLKVNEQVIKGAKNIEAEFKRLIGLPIDLIDALTYRQQKTPGKFLTMTDGEKKEFLSQLLKLNEFEAQIENSKAKANKLEQEFKKHEIILNTLKPTITEPTKPQFTETKTHENNIIELDHKINTQTALLNDKLSKLQDHQNKINNIKNRQLPAIFEENHEIAKLEHKILETKKLAEVEFKKDEEIKEGINKAIKSLTVSINQAHKEISKISGLKLKLQNLSKELQSIEENKCFNCNQVWVVQEDKINELKQEYATTELFLKASQHAESMLPGIVEEKQELEKALWDKSPELENYKAEINSLEVRIIQLKSEIENEKLKKINEFNQSKQSQIAEVEALAAPLITEYNDLKSQIEKIKNSKLQLEYALQSIIKQNQYEEREYKLAVEKYQFILSKYQENENLYNKYKNEFNQETDFAALLKSFLGSIFEEVLIEISDAINDKLKHLPNVSNVVIEFSTENVTQKGVVKQEIKPVVIKNGVKIPLRSGLSGGQSTAVELAIDLAVGEVISRRSNTSLGWLVLDEPFYGLNLESREGCLELLKKASQNRLIMIVDHFITSDLFDQRITIEPNGDESSSLRVS